MANDTKLFRTKSIYKSISAGKSLAKWIEWTKYNYVLSNVLLLSVNGAFIFNSACIFAQLNSGVSAEINKSKCLLFLLLKPIYFLFRWLGLRPSLCKALLRSLEFSRDTHGVFSSPKVFHKRQLGNSFHF